MQPQQQQPAAPPNSAEPSSNSSGTNSSVPAAAAVAAQQPAAISKAVPTTGNQAPVPIWKLETSKWRTALVVTAPEILDVLKSNLRCL